MGEEVTPDNQDIDKRQLLNDEENRTLEYKIKQQQQLRQIALTVTSPHHWIIQGDLAYLERMGCRTVARTIGLGLKPSPPVEKLESDDKGEYYSFTTECEASKDGVSVTQFGYADSRDDFFSHGGKLPLSEINKGNIKKKSVTNAMNRAIVDWLGADFTREEVEKYVGKIGRSIGYDKKPKEELSSQDVDLIDDLKLKIWKLTNKNEEGFKDYLQKLTAWPEKNFAGHTDINKVSMKKLKYIKKKIDEDFEEWAKNEER